MRAQDIIADLTQYASDGLIRNFLSMPEDRRDWKAVPESRSALNQIWECGLVNERFAQFLSGESAEPLSFQMLGELWGSESSDSAEALVEKLKLATTHLCEALRALTDEQLEEMIQLNPEAKLPTKMVMWMGLRNMWYHTGQVAFIQTLYGDGEMH